MAVSAQHLRSSSSERSSDMCGASSSTIDWRCRLLVSSGFPAPMAQRLSATPRVDFHALLTLVDNGCPPELAVRILGPFPDPQRRE